MLILHVKNSTETMKSADAPRHPTIRNIQLSCISCIVSASLPNSGPSRHHGASKVFAIPCEVLMLCRVLLS